MTSLEAGSRSARGPIGSPNPAPVADLATFEKPHQYRVGIGQTSVNGVPVVNGGSLSAAQPGRALSRTAPLD